jgi:hypothetical protein
MVLVLTALLPSPASAQTGIFTLDSSAPEREHEPLKIRDSARQWQHRQEELHRVMNTGIPCSGPVLSGQRWYIICAFWLERFLTFGEA